MLVSDPDAEDAARRLFAARARLLTPAQAETLAIVAYLQPVSRPEIARIRGVNAESAAATLLERGLVEESGRSQFGAVLYRTTDLFLQLFGLAIARRAPADRRLRTRAELEEELRERLLRAGEARTPAPPLTGAQRLRSGRASTAPTSARPACRARAASWPQAAAMSRPRVSRTVAASRGARARRGTPRSPWASSPAVRRRRWGCRGSG